MTWLTRRTETPTVPNRPPVDSVLLLRSLAPYLTKGSVGQSLDQHAAQVDIARALAASRRAPLVLKLVPIPQKVRLVSGSYDPVTHTEAPPVFQESPAQLSWPGSPGPGMV